MDGWWMAVAAARLLCYSERAHVAALELLLLFPVAHAALCVCACSRTHVVVEKNKAVTFDVICFNFASITRAKTKYFRLNIGNNKLMILSNLIERK